MIFSMSVIAMPPPVRDTSPEPRDYEGYPPLTSPGFLAPFLVHGQYPAPPGQYWPQAPHPYYSSPFPVAVLGEPGPSVTPPDIPYAIPQPNYDGNFAMPQAYSAPVGHQDPMEYLGAAIADPTKSPQTKEKLDYDPWKDYNAVMRSIAIGASDPEYCQSFFSYQVRFIY